MSNKKLSDGWANDSMKTKKTRTGRSLKRMVGHPSTSSINRMKRLYRKLCEEHPDPKVQRIAQAMETALRWATEDTRGWRMKEEPMQLAQCLRDDMRMPNAPGSPTTGGQP